MTNTDTIVAQIFPFPVHNRAFNHGFNFGTDFGIAFPLIKELAHQEHTHMGNKVKAELIKYFNSEETYYYHKKTDTNFKLHEWYCASDSDIEYMESDFKYKILIGNYEDYFYTLDELNGFLNEGRPDNNIVVIEYDSHSQKYKYIYVGKVNHFHCKDYSEHNDKFKYNLGQQVIYTNEYGVCFGIKRVIYRVYDNGKCKYIYENSVTPWHPVEEERFTIPDDNDIFVGNNIGLNNGYFQKKYGFDATNIQKDSLLERDFCTEYDN